MKKILVYAMGAVLLLSGCGTYAGSGAYAGLGVGSILGSAIGGISGGARGSDIGTIIGVAGGAAVGAVIGAQADKKAQQDVHDHYMQVQENKARGINPYEESVQPIGSESADEPVLEMNARDFEGPVVDESNSGDDRIEFEPNTE
ncbi:MAG: hypothetical protein IJV27_00860 [Prevotella sp.]|nr:hypothetical protein [Prevotella sp.]